MVFGAREGLASCAPADRSERNSPGPPNPGIVGKAILFARQPVTFPEDWPTEENVAGWSLPSFADIPSPGERIEAGRPILTFFARAETVKGCLTQLQCLAGDLERRLYRGKTSQQE